MWTTVLTPRVSETDGLGHINNTVAATWLEAGRLGLFRIFTPDDDFSQWRMIVVALSLNFHREIFFGSDVTVTVCVSKIGRSSLQLSESIWQDGQLCVTGEATYVNVDPTTKKSAPIPEDVRSVLTRHVCPSP